MEIIEKNALMVQTKSLNKWRISIHTPSQNLIVWEFYSIATEVDELHSCGNTSNISNFESINSTLRNWFFCPIPRPFSVYALNFGFYMQYHIFIYLHSFAIIWKSSSMKKNSRTKVTIIHPLGFNYNILEFERCYILHCRTLLNGCVWNITIGEGERERARFRERQGPVETWNVC